MKQKRQRWLVWSSGCGKGKRVSFPPFVLHPYWSTFSSRCNPFLLQDWAEEEVISGVPSQWIHSWRPSGMCSHASIQVFRGLFLKKGSPSPFQEFAFIHWKIIWIINPKSQMWVISDNYINMGASTLESKSERLKIYSSEYLKISDLE